MPKKDATRSTSLTSQDSNNAVILADMVADVPVQDSTHATTRTRHTDNNGAVAVVNVDTTETVNVAQQPQGLPHNGTDITKGVILNAYLEQGLKNGSKTVELQMGPPQEKQEKAEKGGPPESIPFRDMSTGRKVAFAASFLPSIMFVLCFAVILPCQQRAPCVEEVWNQQLNDTKITSRLLATESIVFTFTEGGPDRRGLLGLDPDAGRVAWGVILDFDPTLVGCDHFSDPDRKSCLVLEPLGAFHLFSATDGTRLLRSDITGAKQAPSLPAVLPNCEGGGLSSFALSSSAQGQIKVVEGGNKVRTVQVPGCESPPLRLTPWRRTANRTDLVLLCRKQRDDAVILLKQETWCNYENAETAEATPLYTKKAGSLMKSLLLPTPLGLLVWSEDEVVLVHSSGQVNWTMPTQPHSDKNRFLFTGKFRDAGMQIALFSSGEATKFRATLMNTETGETEWNSTLPDSDVSDVILIHGENKDFVLLSMRKTLKQAAVAQFSEVPTTILSVLDDKIAEVGGSNSSGSSPSQEFDISLLEMGGSYHPIHDEPLAEGAPNQIKIAVLPEKKDGLDIVIVRTPPGEHSDTMVSKMRIRNWDISLEESKQCAMK